MGVVEALRVLIFGIVIWVFLLPPLFENLVPGLQTTLAGSAWGNIVLLGFMSLGTLIGVAVIVKLSRVLYSQHEPEMDMSPNTVNLFDERGQVARQTETQPRGSIRLRRV